MVVLSGWINELALLSYCALSLSLSPLRGDMETITFVIDVGNTQVKLAKVNDDSSVLRIDLADVSSTLSRLEDLNPGKSLRFFGMASGQLASSILASYDFTWITHSDDLPLHSAYTTMSTLGMDRWALCNAYALEGHNSFLLLTVGTCITYNVVVDKSFKGGAISPGWGMRYEAMNSLTASLPKSQYNVKTGLLGTDTNTSLQAGVDIAIVKEIQAMIEDYQSTFDLQQVIICGGDSRRLSKHLKKHIFAPANYELHALKRLHEYYVKNDLF